MPELYDMHCHLDFADNCIDVAREANGRIGAVCSTVVPSSFVSAREKFAEWPEIRVGLGIHPWWVADGRIGAADVRRFETLVPETRIIGEVGLDFHGKRKATRTHQLDIFARILQSISDNGNGRLVFLHAVKSYSDTFALIEHYGTLHDNTCVFHWFQGSRDDFGRALAEGFMFSVGMRMMASDAGAFFAKEIPYDRLLIETDNPPHEGMPWSYDIWEQEIGNTARALAELRNVSESEILATVSENSARLLQEYDAIPTGE